MMNKNKKKKRREEEKEEKEEEEKKMCLEDKSWLRVRRALTLYKEHSVENHKGVITVQSLWPLAPF